MNRKNVNMVLSIVLGGAILFAGYKMYEKYEQRKALEAVNGVLEKVYSGQDKDGIPPKVIDTKDYDKEIELREEKEERLEERDSIYKKGITEKRVDELEYRYEREVGDFTGSYGSLFRQLGRPGYGPDAEGLAGAKDFYKIADRILNNLWSDLHDILKPDVYKALQKEQVAWIKERDRKASQKGKEGSFGYIDEQGVETYRRVVYLMDNYLD
ncbi:MAG: lysozyme inhibitor LprI family protein [Clostridium sp.]